MLTLVLVVLSLVVVLTVVLVVLTVLTLVLVVLTVVLVVLSLLVVLVVLTVVQLTSGDGGGEIKSFRDITSTVDTTKDAMVAKRKKNNTDLEDMSL